ncbi:hypothetical protein ACN27G_06010 [Plantactinospora sp. WMMB334]|uniref:hypothetical protein n=1 Tax=Plantactinospora sp. WMMB334 TaxID=3404119 RepID=UPI003B92E6C4
MGTTESILADLARQRDGHAGAGRLAEVRRVEQEMIAHLTLARLRARLAGYRRAGDAAAVARLVVQVDQWRRRVTVDVDEPDQVAEPEVATLPAGAQVTARAAVDEPGPAPARPAGKPKGGR